MQVRIKHIVCGILLSTLSHPELNAWLLKAQYHLPRTIVLERVPYHRQYTLIPSTRMMGPHRGMNCSQLVPSTQSLPLQHGLQPMQDQYPVFNPPFLLGALRFHEIGDQMQFLMISVFSVRYSHAPT